MRPRPRPRPLAGLVPLLAVALACQPPDTSAAAKQAIDAANANWARLTAAGHADSIAEFYDDNAVLFPPNMPAVRGKEAIRAFFAEMNALRPTLTLRAESVWGASTWALELGRWTFAWPAGATRPPGVPAADSGRYLVRWVQNNGRWLMAENLWNSELPMPGAPAQ